MTDFINLSPEKKEYLLRSLIAGSQQLAVGDGTAAQNLETGPGTIESITNSPTQNELTNFKVALLSLGYMDKLLVKLPLIDIKIANMIADKSLSTQITENTIANYGSEALRKLGYTEEESKNQLLQSAIGEPRKYLEKKFKNIAEINKIAYKTWQEAYAKYREFGYDEDTAFKKAKRAADAYKDQLMKQHEEEFPEKLTNDAKSRIIDK